MEEKKDLEMETISESKQEAASSNDTVDEESTVENEATEATDEGTPAAEESSSLETEIVEETTVKKKKSIVKKWWFWLIVASASIIVSLVLLIAGVGIISAISGGGNGGGGGVNTPTVDPYVQMVKGATNSTYGITYGKAFDSFFTGEKWSHFVSSDGTHVVEFEGDAYYGGNPADYKVQFLLSDDLKTFSVGYVGVNGVAQNAVFRATLIKTVFESYDN